MAPVPLFMSMTSTLAIVALAGMAALGDAPAGLWAFQGADVIALLDRVETVSTLGPV